MERPTCKTCPYWEYQDESGNDVPRDLVRDGEYGNCHRHAPQAMTQRCGDDYVSDPHAAFVEIIEWNWCGEHPDFPAYIASLKRGPKSAPEMTLGEALNDPMLANFAHPRMINALKDGPEASAFYDRSVMRIHARELRAVRNFGEVRELDFSKWQKYIAGLRTLHPDTS